MYVILVFDADKQRWLRVHRRSNFADALLIYQAQRDARAYQWHAAVKVNSDKLSLVRTDAPNGERLLSLEEFIAAAIF